MRAPKGAGSIKTQSAQAPLWVFIPPHFCGCWNTSCSFIATAKTSHTTGTLSDNFAIYCINTRIVNLKKNDKILKTL
jgi:hypothetical protein